MRLIDWRAAIAAGIAAAIVSTLAQAALWIAFTDAFPAILLRDARLAAAIVMGRGVLDDAPTLDPTVMIVATVVHFGLSIAYAVVLSALIARRGLTASLAIGALFGSLLHGINMYGFTLVFPWFEVARDPITLAAHVAFGLSAALTYRLLAQSDG